MPTQNQSNTLFREAAIQDMMGKPPGWLLHSGLGAIAVVLTVSLSLAAFIRYPEKVEAPFLLQTEQVPLALHAGAMNVIDTVFTHSGATVFPGDTLVIFRSEVNWPQIRILDCWLADVEEGLYTRPLDNPDVSITELLIRQLTVLRSTSNYPATIQNPFINLRAVLGAYESYRQTSGVIDEVKAFESEIADAKRLSISLSRQVELYEKELGYQVKRTDRMSGLEADGIVSTQDLEDVTAQTISARRQREVLVSSDIQNQMRVQQLRQQILQRQLEHREKLADFDRQVLVQLKLIRSALNDYRERYVLTAREAGVLDWQPFVRVQATVTPSEPLGYLMSLEGQEEKIARLQLPAIGQGNVAVGDRVILDFAAYPSRQYGQVEGTLTSVAPVAIPGQNGSYVRLATVALSDTLNTSYGKTLLFRYNLTGTARVITAERTLLQRVLDQFLDLTKNT